MGKINIPTSEAVKQLKLVVTELRALKKEAAKTGRKSAGSLKKIEDQLKKIKTLNGTAGKSFKLLQTSIEKNTRAVNGNTASQRSARVASNQLTGAIYKKIAADKKATLTSKINTVQNKKQAASFFGITKGIVNLLKTYGLLAGAMLLKRVVQNVFELTKEFDSLKFSMETVVKTAFEVGSTTRFLRGITEDFGTEIVTTTKRYIKFIAAAQQSGISLATTEKIFRSTTKAASVLGLKTDELTGIYLALEQMLSKGKVTTEELRRQLGERLPGAMGIMAAALDVTIPKLDEMLKKGEVLSADALPKFAEALELAYGINAVDKVTTLIAEQNRLSNAWKLWIKDVTEGDSIIKKFFAGAISGLTEFIEMLSGFTQSNELKFMNKVIDESKRAKVELKFEADVILKQNGIFIKNYEKQIQDARIDVVSAVASKKTNPKAVKEAQQRLKDLLDLALKQQKLIEEANKAVATNNIKESLVAFREQEKLYNKELSTLKVLQAAYDKTQALNPLHILKRVQIKSKIKAQVIVVDQLGDSFARATANFDLYNSLLQEDSPQALNNLKANTDELDKRIAVIKKLIEIHKQNSDNEGWAYDRRKDQLDKLALNELKLLDLQKQRQIVLAAGDPAKLFIIEQNYLKETIILTDKLIKKNTKLHGSELSEIMAQANKKRDAQLEEINTRYSAMGVLTKELEKKMAAEIKEVKKELNNEGLVKQSEFLISVLQLEELSVEQRIKLRRKLAAILAKIDGTKNGLKKIKDDLQARLETVRDFLNELGNLFNAFGARRLESIEAEIRAEETKYDKLIKLAENDTSRKLALEEEKDDKLRKLDEKRLKEEQRQAKIRKAFALAEVAINTAVAVSKVWGQTGVFGIVAQIPVIIMGALQAATILAQPIPQYKMGLDNAKTDHVAMINDGGVQEYVGRKGRILTTSTKNAIVQLKQGDEVFRDEKSMLASNATYKQVANSVSAVNMREIDVIGRMEKGIIKGFSKAKINTKVVVNQQSVNNYLNQKARY